MRCTHIHGRSLLLESLHRRTRAPPVAYAPWLCPEARGMEPELQNQDTIHQTEKYYPSSTTLLRLLGKENCRAPHWKCHSDVAASSSLSLLAGFQGIEVELALGRVARLHALRQLLLLDAARTRRGRRAALVAVHNLGLPRAHDRVHRAVR